MTKREKIREKQLMQLEAEFRALLPVCLERCARGRYGLFGQNSHLDPDGQYWGWPEADRLKELAGEITSIRAQFGEVNEDCKQFLALCSLRGANVPGEPKLAADFLAKIQS